MLSTRAVSQALAAVRLGLSASDSCLIAANIARLTTWEATLAPLFRMQARGLTKDMLKPGTPVVVEGYPSTCNQHETGAERITVAGKTIELR